MTTQSLTNATGGAQPAIPRAAAAAWALTAYAVGMFGLFWVILAAGGLAPHGLTGLQAGSVIFRVDQVSGSNH